MLSFEKISSSVQIFLNDHMSPMFALLFQFVIVGTGVLTLFAILGLVLVFMERKVSAYMQIRIANKVSTPVPTITN